MKHLKQLLILVLLTFIGIGQMWAANASFTITFGTGSGDGTEATTSTSCATIVSNGSSYLSGNLATATRVYYNGSSGLKLGASSSKAGTLKMNLSTSGQVTPTSIVVNAKRYNSNKAVTLKVNGSSTQSLTSSFDDYTYDITSAITYIQIDCSQYCWISSITVNYTTSGGGSGKTDLSSNQLAWSAASATVTKDGNNNVYPTLTNSIPVTVSYSSTNTNVATINESTGIITLVKGGQTTIKANFAGDNTYNAKEVSYTLTVNKPTIAGGMTDEITITTTGVTSNSYTAFSGKSASNTGHSNAVYAGKVIKNTNDIQLNTIGNADNSTGRGIASTTSGGLVKRVEVIWGSSSMNNGRKVSIYGSNTAYEGTETAVVSANKLGDITYATGATSDYFDIEGSYKYVQLVVDGAAYVNKFNITWVAPPTYTINTSTTGCSLTVKKGNANVTSAAEGDEISVSATANTGRHTPSISVKDADNNPVTVANGKFTMPAKAVTVTATATEIDYTVTVNQNPSVSATTTGQTTTAHYNGTINLTTTVPSGYAFVNWTTTDGFSITNATSATTASFTMPAKNVAVTANFRKLVQSITVKNGETNVSGQIIEMTVGDVINLSVDFTPSDAYDKSLTWNTGDNTKATLSNGTLTAVAATTSNVTMTVSTPDLNDPVTFYVKVNAPVGNVVTLSQPVLGGTVDASPKGEVDEDTEVTLSYSALSTHEFVEWIVKDEENNDVTVTNNKFTMIDKDITVSASFRPKAPVFTLEEGEYEGNQVVKLTSFDDTKFLYYYTLNGDDPDDNSTSYDDNTNGITLTESATLKMIVFDAEIQQSTIASATYTITHTPASLTLSENGNEVTFDDGDDHYLNDVISLPDDVDNAHKIQGKVFKGWSSVQITTPVNIKPSANFFEPGADYTLSTTAPKLYAVYATEVPGAATWNEITSVPTAGTYAIYAAGYFLKASINDGGRFDNGNDGTDIVSDGKLTSAPDDNCQWEVSINAASKFLFKNDTKYAAGTGAKNKGQLITDATDTKAQWTITYSNGFVVTNVANSEASVNAILRQNDSYGWACYSGDQGGADGAPRFFKKIAGPSTYNAYTTSVASYDVTAAVCENGSVSANVAKATENATVTITATPNTGYDLLSFDVYKTGESNTKVDFTVDPDNYKQATFSMPAYAVTVSATFIKVGTAENPLTVAELIASQANLDGYYVYAQGVVSQLGSFNSYNGYYTYYFSADGTTTSQFEVYNGYKGSHQEGDDWYYDGFENAFDLALGDEVTVEGYIKYFNNTKYQFEAQNSELTSYCRPVVVTKGAESYGTFTITANEESITTNKKYCLAELSGANDLTVTVEAEPAAGYRLKRITSLDGETVVGTVGAISNNSCTITGIKASTTITANFEQVFAVSLAVNTTGTLHGDYTATINGAADPVSVAAGETINLAASVVSADDEFVNWTATEGITIANATALSTTATATQAGTITANFRPLADPHTITNGGVNAAYGTIVMKDMEDNVVTSLNLRPDKTGKLVATETDGYRFTGWTVTPANAVTFTDASAMETTFAAKDVAATISANYEARTAYTVKFMNGNTQIGDDATVYDGRTIDLLGAQTSFDPNHTVFCGWVTSNFDGVADAEPTFVTGAQTITGNTTFYAVYGNAVETNNYKKITYTNSLEGNYVIVAKGSTSAYAMKANIPNNKYNLAAQSVTIGEGDIISNPDAALIWAISPSSSDVKFKNGDNWAKIYNDGNHTNLILTTTDADNTFSVAQNGSTDAFVFTTTVSVGTNNQIEYYNNEFKPYNSQNADYPIYLYKQVLVTDEWVSKPIEYVNVYFKTNAGEEAVTNMPADILKQVKGYSLVAPLETPARGGYNFVGWNTDNEATVAMAFPKTINENTDVYAIWQAYPDCAIDLYVNGVKDDDISTSVKQGAELDLSAIDAPERLGYDFLGWAANPRLEENTTAIDIVEAYTPTPNVDTEKSFYAVYTRTEGEAQYEKASSISAGKYLIVCEDQEVAFDGSLDALDGAGKVVAVNISDDVIAYSETIDAKTFTIAAITGGYSIQSASGIYIGRTADANEIDESTSTVYTNTITITNGDADIVGSGGAHLRCNPNSGNQWFRYFKSSSYKSQKAIQLYKYIAGTTYYTTNPAVNYNVSYNLAGGAWKEDEGCESAIVAANDSYDVCEDVPFKTDNIFTGWTVGGEAIGASITVTETTEIVANYRAAETYSVTYDANGALGTAPAAASVKEGANYTVLANSWFFKAGYSFTGWNTAADGNGTAYAKDAVITMPSENLTLYAQWSNSISERDVVIVAHYGDKYYAMGQTLSSGQLNAVQVQMFNGKVRDVAEENRAAITWHMIVNSSNNTVSFYSPANEKYLGAGSSTNLALSEDAVEWIWDSETKCYKVSEGTRTFWYRNTESGKDADYYNYFKYFSISGSVGKDYFASEMILAYGFAVTIDGNATESALTIGDDVVVTEDAELTINSERVLNSLTVEAGGSLKLNDGAAKKLIVNDLTINTQSGASGQVSGSNVHVSGDIYLEIKLCEGVMDAEASRKWYCISAPFNVNMNGGFFWADGTEMVLNTHFQMFEFDGEKRASTGNGWKRVSGTMKKNTAYFIGFDDKRVGSGAGMNQNTIKLKADANTIPTAEAMQLAGHSSAIEGSNDWYGLGNPALQYVGVNMTAHVFTCEVQGYDVIPHWSTNFNGFVVGSAFFVQGTGVLSFDNAASAYHAPKRQVEEYTYCVEIAKEGASRYDNRIFVRASEDAEAEFVPGKDEYTLNGTTSNYGALLWTENYGGKRLAIEEAPLVNGTASYVLTLSAPQAGTYSISVAAPKENADLYLTYEGSIIWNLSEGAYTMDLNKGITNGYGLILRANAPSAATGIDEAESGKQKAESVQKIILDEKVFILRGGKMYDVTGKAVK